MKCIFFLGHSKNKIREHNKNKNLLKILPSEPKLPPESIRDDLYDKQKLN